MLVQTMKWGKPSLRAWLMLVVVLLMKQATLAQGGARVSAPSGPSETTPQRPTFTADTWLSSAT
jgi:hypothetical protein